MSREIRRVPLNWTHPVEWVQRIDRFARDGSTRPELSFKPLFADRERFPEYLAEWEAEPNKGDWARPDLDAQWMPDFSDVPEDQMGICMYETTTEGTPISPVFKDPDELAHWLADNNASAFGGQGATYEQWRAMIGEGWAPSAIVTRSDGVISGVEFVGNRKEQ